MKRLMAPVGLMILLSLSSCQPLDDPDTGHTANGFSMDLPDFFDCVRETGGVVLASHRAGPTADYPENALETLQYAQSHGIFVHEIDIAESRDGVLFLMHDDRLERTTTGRGHVARTEWDRLKDLRLIDPQGRKTAYAPAKLSDVLIWAKKSGAIVELDRKSSTSFARIIQTVRKAGAENHVILITYTPEQAFEVARLAPDLMMTIGITSLDQQVRLEAEGIDMRYVIAWMGTRSLDVQLTRGLAARGIETAFGTLGRPETRLDAEFWADGDPSEYQALMDQGLTLLASDEIYNLAAAFTSAQESRVKCGYNMPD